MKIAQIAALIMAGLLLAAATTSNDPSERLANPAQEAHARALFREVRCLECQNESIDESEAPIAADLRRVVRAQVAARRSDAEVKRYLTDRYGEFVLLRPPFSPGNAILWLTPFAVVVVGGAAMILRARRPRPDPEPLTAEEKAALAALDSAAGQGSAAEAPHEKRSDVAEAGG